MTNSKIFGKIYASIYDEIYNYKNYVEECNILEQIFKNNVTSVLDLGCGTGSHAAELSTRGYSIVGLDQSYQMIKVAQEKNLTNCVFKQNDIRTFNLNQSFDAVLLMFNVVGYLLDQNSLISLFSTARQHLNTGGLLIFDFWYAPAIRHNPPSKSNKKSGRGDLSIYRKTVGKLDPKYNFIQINCDLKKGSTKDRESHTVRYFDLDELRSLVFNSRFNNISFSEFDDITKVPNKNNWQAIAWSNAI